jgi:outer membrane protein TolC
VILAFGLDRVRADEPTVLGLLRTAVDGNPELQATAADVLAAEAKIPQAGALPDPVLGIAAYLVPVETRVGPQQAALQASQSFPWFGTLGAQADHAEATALAAADDLDAKILEVMTRIRTQILEIAYLDSAIAVTHRHRLLLTQWESSAQDAYAANRSSYHALVKAQVEIGALNNRVASLEDRRGPLVTALNADLDRPLGTPLGPVVLPTVSADLPEYGDLAEQVRTHHPRLRRWLHLEDAAAAKDKVATKMGLPGFSLGLTMIRTGEARMDGVTDSGKDALVASAGIRVPLWRGKYSAARDEARQNGLRARKARSQALNELTAELDMTLYRLRDAVRQMELYNSSLVPKAEQSLTAALDAYAASQSDFLDVIDAERLLLEFQLAASRARTDALIQQARLEALAASPLDEIPRTTEPRSTP